MLFILFVVSVAALDENECGLANRVEDNSCSWSWRIGCGTGGAPLLSKYSWPFNCGKSSNMMNFLLFEIWMHRNQFFVLASYLSFLLSHIYSRVAFWSRKGCFIHKNWSLGFRQKHYQIMIIKNKQQRHSFFFYEQIRFTTDSTCIWILFGYAWADKFLIWLNAEFLVTLNLEDSGLLIELGSVE